MADSIREWLRSIEMGQYAEAFEKNDLDLSIIAELSDADLKELGITSMGHRKLLLRAIGRPGENPITSSAVESLTDTDFPAGAHPNAERRQLTVFFCDLVGSTVISQQLDPEDLRDLMRRYQDAVAGAVTRFGGHVAKYLGDGVLAYFGWPKAHEDQSERAVRAGIDAIDAVSCLTWESGRLQARIGIATGPVVVGDLIGETVSEAEAVSGETPNRAARLQEIAKPGQILIGAATARLLGQNFELDELGQQPLKGFKEPVFVWRVAAERRLESRFDATRRTKGSPLVGREHEVALLRQRWERALEGEGQVVLLSGEPGVGKSRILDTLCNQIGLDSHTRLRYQCVSYHAQTALHPIIAQLERASGLSAADSAASKLNKLESLLGLATDRLESVVPLIATLLSLPFEEQYGHLSLTPQQQKIRTFEALIEQLLGLASSQPVLFLLEDAHWIDPTTQELLDMTVERIRSARVMMLVTHRPEFAPDWHRHSHLTALALNRLGRSQCMQIIKQIADGRALPDDVLDQILEKTDGVPLFVEELTKAVLESDLLVEVASGDKLTGSLADLAIPMTLRDSLIARLDRLGAVKEVAQIGAVIGREFPQDLIEAIVDHVAEDLESSLDQLVASELVFRRANPQSVTYVFKHALVQDAAYGSLLKRRRQDLHHKIALHLSDRAGTSPELLAHHYTQAGLLVQAIPHWQKAGERASKRSSNAEAVANLKKALELLGQMPESKERDRREFDLLIKLGPPLMQNRGWSDPSVRKLYERAQQLCKNSDLPEDNFMATWGVWMHKQARSEHRDAEAIADRLLHIAREADHTDLLLQAHHSAWTTYLYTGRPAIALDHIDAGIEVYDPKAHGHHALIYAGHDPAVCAYYQKAMALWLLGFPDQASQSSRLGMSLANELAHVPTIAHAKNFAARFESMRRNPEEAAAYANSAIKIGEEVGLPVSKFQGGMVLGWAQVYSGDDEVGLMRLGEASQKRQASNHRSGAPHYQGIFADACLVANRLSDAERQIEHGLQLVAETGEALWEAELWRLYGELCRRKNAPVDAEKHLHKAIETARSQNTKSLELRAATSLARFMVDEGEHLQAHSILAPVYQWFTEGYDTADLAAAGSLLDDLR